MPRVKVGPKYQVVIPKAVRRKIGLRPGDLVEVAQKRDAIVVRKANPLAVDRYAGILKGVYDEYGGSEAYLEAERNSWDKESV